ncbi:ROK family transcriptional regulator [Kitasatospora sp. Root187]|nr:ROK family transcriptional regulator [Kitasatospora sp. Root107]KRB69985.1 ROK family transcriptional regulator [Kitasatospora sp. Root187]
MFTTVLTGGPVSRVEIARRTGLSSAAVTRTARPFIEAGYLEETEAGERTAPGAGRPANPLAIRADREFFIGVKITNEDLIGVVCDLRAQVRTSRHHVLTTQNVDGVVAALAELVEELLSESDAYRERTYCLGVAVSGDVDRASGLVRYSPFLGWRDVPLAALLSDATGLATTLENDVKALTVAEQWFGKGVGASSFALVTVGTGIGCAMVVNGGLVAGAHNVAGELGHVRVADAGPVCHCGGSGCIEAIASSGAIVTQARLASGDAELSMDEAVTRARAGEEGIRSAFDRAGHAIGLGLAAVANLIGPERIVVSGEGLAAYDLFEEQIRETFAVQAFGAAARCELIIRPLPFEEWARGAAATAVQTLFTTESV